MLTEEHHPPKELPPENHITIPPIFLVPTHRMKDEMRFIDGYDPTHIGRATHLPWVFSDWRTMNHSKCG